MSQAEIFFESRAAERFREFHRENPQVYDRLLGLALEWKRRGRTRCGIGMLWEVLRWQTGMETGGDPYKLNNNYRSRYARLMMEREPELLGFFETRELHT